MQGELFHGMEKNIRHTEEMEEERELQKTSIFEQFQLTLSFDKIVIASISVVVLLAVTFAMGVEKGKQKALQINATQGVTETQPVIQQEWSTITSNTAESADRRTLVVDNSTRSLVDDSGSFVSESSTNSSVYPNDLSQQSTEVRKQTDKSGLKKSQDENKKFTIRVASYVSQTPAKHTATKLSKKGFEAFVKQSGKYYVLNVGSFSVKDDAQATLLRVRKELGLGKEGFILSI